MARPTKAKAMERLRKVLNGIPELKRLPYNSPVFEKWRRDAEVAIANAFGRESSHVGEFKKSHSSLFARIYAESDSELQTDHVKGLDSYASVLESMLNEIEEYWEEYGHPSDLSDSGARPSEEHE